MFLLTIFMPGDPFSVLFPVYIKINKFLLSIFMPFQPRSIRNAVRIMHFYFFISVIIPFQFVLIKFPIYVFIFSIHISVGIINYPFSVSPVLGNAGYFMNVASVTFEEPSLCFYNTVRVIISPHSIHPSIFIGSFHLFIFIIIKIYHLSGVGIFCP